jgi:glycine reductase
MRIVHYLNQFFGGLGGEERAGAALEVREGAIGPGKLLEELLGADARVVTTLVCGDNYAVENQKLMIDGALQAICAAKVDLLVAGPCFLAGRYGLRRSTLFSGAIEFGDSVITGMAQENPGVDLYRDSSSSSIPATTGENA